MKKAIFPIDVEIGYKTEEEKKKKLDVITKLLTAIVKSKDKYNDVNQLNKYLSVIKWEKQPLHHYVISIIWAVLFVIISSVIILDITIYKGNLVSWVYMWGEKAYWYVVNEEGIFKYHELSILGCDEFNCHTDKGYVMRRLIDYYTVK